MAKDILYTHLLRESGEIARVGETYWRHMGRTTGEIGELHPKEVRAARERALLVQELKALHNSGSPTSSHSGTTMCEVPVAGPASLLAVTRSRPAQCGAPFPMQVGDRVGSPTRSRSQSTAPRSATRNSSGAPPRRPCTRVELLPQCGHRADCVRERVRRATPSAHRGLDSISNSDRCGRSRRAQAT